MQRIVITELDDPRLDVFRDLKTSNTTRNNQLFVVEGTTLVERLFRSKYEVAAVMASTQKLERFAERLPSTAVVYEMSKELATKLVGYQFHLGVVAAAKREPVPNLSQITETHSSTGLVILGEQLIDQQNVGMLIRIASAFGADSVILSAGSADAFSRRVIRVSTGNVLFVPVIENVDTVESIRELQKAGFTCCATTLSNDAFHLSQFKFPPRTVLMFGNETHGLTDAALQAADVQLTIPMLNGTDSINVSVAAGIFAHSFRAQHPHHGEDSM